MVATRNPKKKRIVSISRFNCRSRQLILVTLVPNVISHNAHTLPTRIHARPTHVSHTPNVTHPCQCSRNRPQINRDIGLVTLQHTHQRNKTRNTTSLNTKLESLRGCDGSHNTGHYTYEEKSFYFFPHFHRFGDRRIPRDFGQSN